MLANLPTRNRGPYLDKCKPVPLVTNLFKVDFKQDTKIYIFAARTQPKISFDNNKKLRTMLINSRKTIEKMIGTFVLTGRMVFATKAEQCQVGEDVTFKIDFEGQEYNIMLKLVKPIVLKDLYCQDKRRSGIVFGFLNSMLKNFFYQIGYGQIGRTGKYFDAKHFTNVESAKVFIYKGYASNFNLLQAGLFLRIDSAVKVVRNQTALSVIQAIYSKNSKLSKQEKRSLVEMELIGKTVMANYGKSSHYMIESLIFDTPVDKYFFSTNNSQINLVEYYQKTYGISINLKQPLLKAVNSRSSKSKKQRDCILVPELMLMGGLSDDFDERKRRQVSQHTIVPPSHKYKDFSSVFKNFSENDDELNPKVISEKLGISFNKNPTQFNGKQLKLPELQLGKRDRIDERKTTMFQLFNKEIFSPKVPLLISVIHPQGFDFSSTKQLMNSTCKNLGLRYEFLTHEIKYQDQNGALKNIRQYVERQCQSTETTPNIFWIIIPPNFKSRYGEIKKIMLDKGIEKNSQITVSNKFQAKSFASVFTKILLQMAAKVGNKLWVPKVSDRLPESGVMMLGIEKCNVSSDSTVSMLTYCSNSDRECSEFYSNYIIHKKEQDFKTHLNQIIFNCLTEYVRCNGEAPKDILLIKNDSAIRDNQVLISSQISEIKDVLKTWKGSNPINIIYVLLDKKTDQKFFIERNRDIVNPQSGLLVNSEAVGQGYQFYLIAQHCNKGAVRPTFYRVIYNDSDLEEGVMQELLFGQCFNYMNWSGSIKVPAVMQYAKKLSIFAGQSLGGDKYVCENLSRHLYYI